MLQSLSIIQKLLISFTFLLALMLGIGIYSINQCSWFNEQYQQVAVNTLPSVVASAKLKADFLELRRGELRYLLTTPEKKPDELNKVNAIVTRLDQDLTAYKDLLSLDKERQDYNELLPLWSSYKSDVLAQILNLEQAGKHAEAVDVIMNKGAQVLNQMMPLAIDIMDVNVQYGNDIKDQFNDGYSSVIKYLTSGLILALLIGAGFAFAVIRAIQIPLGLLGTQVEQVASGELRNTLDLSQFASDELGALARSFRKMQDNLRSIIHDVSMSAEQLTTASEEMSSVAQQSSAGVQKQMHDVELLATSLNELQSTVQDVSRSCNDAAHAASGATTDVKSGLNIVSDAVASTEKVATAMARASEITSGLENNSRSIGSVLDVIRGIAEQTNLLALNAAIEAARAGDQGRGFAVVADEVRTLAKRTQDSTAKVNIIIEELQAASIEAKKTMDLSQEQIISTVEKAREAGLSIERISHSVLSMADRNNQIATATEEQSTVTESLNYNVVSIQDAATEVSSGAEQTAAACTSLSQLAINLQGLVGKFKV